MTTVPASLPRATAEDALALARERYLGGARVDMRDLATTLGIGRATLYRWFGNREQLLSQVLSELLRETVATCRARQPGLSVEELVEVALMINDSIMSSSALSRWIESEPEVAMRVVTAPGSLLQRQATEVWTGLLEEAAAAGADFHLDTDLLAFVLVRVGQALLWGDVLAGVPPERARSADVYRALLT